jgi:hypothetical protein
MAVPQSGTTGWCLVSSRAGRERGVRPAGIRWCRGVEPAVRASTQPALSTGVDVRAAVARTRCDADVDGVARKSEDFGSERGGVAARFGAHQAGSPLFQPHQDTHQEAHQKSVSAGHGRAIERGVDAPACEVGISVLEGLDVRALVVLTAGFRVAHEPQARCPPSRRGKFRSARLRSFRGIQTDER